MRRAAHRKETRDDRLRAPDAGDASPQRCAARDATRCDEAIAAIVATPAAERTFANTFVALESAADIVVQAIGRATPSWRTSPTDDALRETAREWDEKLSKYAVELGFREDLYEAVKEYAATAEAAALAGEEQRLLERTLRDYRRNGFELPKEQRERVQELMNRLVELGTEFRKAIDTWDDGIVVTREELAGMPDRWIDGLKTVDEDGETKYRVSLDYPEIMPFMDNAESGELRRELFLKNQNKGGDANIKVLEEAIRVRSEIAHAARLRLVGGVRRREAHGEDARRTSTASSRDLEREARSSRPRPTWRRSRDAKQEHTGDGEIEIWDWWFYTNRLLKTEYAVDDFEVANYFPLDAVHRRPVPGHAGAARHPLRARAGRAELARRRAGVRHLRRRTATEPFARFYMDLYPRPNKFGHAAAFTLRGGRALAGRHATSSRSAPSSRTSRSRPPDAPSLLRHTEVVTFFHEFGHILHQTLTRARYLEFSGSSTERDFVEAPSQMLEHWVWDRDVLRPLRAAPRDGRAAAGRPARRDGAREERQLRHRASCGRCSSRGSTSRSTRRASTATRRSAVRGAVPDHRLPVPGGHALPVRLRAPVRLRRRLLRLPLVARVRRRHVHALRARRRARSRRPGSTTGARSSSAAARSTATSSCATFLGREPNRTRSCADSASNA